MFKRCLFLLATIVCLSSCNEISSEDNNPSSSITDNFVVSFNGNGGELVRGSEIQRVTNNSEIIPPVYKRDGYKQIGWDPLISSINTDTICKALWEVDQLSNESIITFDCNGGKMPIGYDTVLAVQTGTRLSYIPTPTRDDGTSFLGWFKDYSNSEISLTNNTLIQGDCLYVARWSQYKINYFYFTNYNFDNFTIKASYIDHGLKLSSDRNYYTTTAYAKNQNNIYKNNKHLVFTGWDYGEREVFRDVDVYGLYNEKDYHVVYFTTYLNGSIVDTNSVKVDDGDLVNRYSPTKKGYVLGDWKNGEEVFDFSTQIRENLHLVANYTPATYKISIFYDDKDEIPDDIINVLFNESFSLESAEPFAEIGYTFLYWYSPDFGYVYEGESKIYSVSKDTSFLAVYGIASYLITYNLDGGILEENNPSSYNVFSDITLNSPKKTGYNFIGWYDENNTKIERIVNRVGHLKLTAKYEPILYELSVSSDSEKGTVSIIKGTGYYDEEICVKASPKDGYIFYGWFIDMERVSTDKEYTFKMPSKNIIIRGVFIKDDGMSTEESIKFAVNPLIIDEKHISYGLYPQKRINSSDLINRITSEGILKENNYYLFDNTYYAKVTANPLRDDYYRFSDGSKVIKGVEYWFECEPIIWEILNVNNYNFSLFSKFILDGCTFGTTSCDYYNSNLRTFLNSSFLDSAFYFNKTNLNHISFSDEGTSINDYVSAMDKDDLLLESYGFSKKNENDKGRSSTATDWALANGAEMQNLETLEMEGYGSSYWTRTKYPYGTGSTWFVQASGYITSSAKYTTRGVRPILNINL